MLGIELSQRLEVLFGQLSHVVHCCCPMILEAGKLEWLFVAVAIDVHWLGMHAACVPDDEPPEDELDDELEELLEDELEEELEDLPEEPPDEDDDPPEDELEEVEDEPDEDDDPPEEELDVEAMHLSGVSSKILSDFVLEAV